MKTGWHNRIGLWMALLWLLLSACPFPAAAERDTVRIGYFISEKYGYEGADGDARGYDVHLSKTIAMYGGFEA